MEGDEGLGGSGEAAVEGYASDDGEGVGIGLGSVGRDDGAGEAGGVVAQGDFDGRGGVAGSDDEGVTEEVDAVGGDGGDVTSAIGHGCDAIDAGLDIAEDEIFAGFGGGIDEACAGALSLEGLQGDVDGALLATLVSVGIAAVVTGELFVKDDGEFVRLGMSWMGGAWTGLPATSTRPWPKPCVGPKLEMEMS